MDIGTRNRQSRAFFFQTLTVLRKVQELGIATSPSERNEESSARLGTILNISANGDVYPCPFLPSAMFLAGNVRKKDLATIYGESVVFRALRASGACCCQQLPAPERLVELYSAGPVLSGSATCHVSTKHQSVDRGMAAEAARDTG